MDMVLIGLAVGLLVGAVVGLVGAGGAIIAVPALVYVAGLDPQDAIPTSLIVVGLASLTGALPRLRRDVSWPLVLLIGVSGIPASWAGAAAGSRLDEDWLMLLFALIMIVAGLRILASASTNGTRTRTEPAGWAALALRGIPVGLAVGFLTGLLGVGGGFLIIPALTLLLGVPMSRAIGTSLVIIAINSASGFAAHLDGLDIDWTLTLTFAAAAMAASLAAARIAHRLNDAVVSRVFAVIVFAVALAVLVLTVPALFRTGPAAPAPSPSPASPSPAPQPEAAVTASLTASRLSIGERTINVVIENGTGKDLDITAASLSSPRYQGPAAWVPADGDGTTLRPGGRVALPVVLPPAACPDSEAASTTAAGASVLLTLGGGETQTLPAPDPFASLETQHGQDCLQQAVDAVAVFALEPELEVPAEGNTAVVRIAVTPSGAEGTLTLAGVGTTTLLTEAPGKPWPRDVPVSGEDPPIILELHTVPMRCDSHALAEDKAGTRLPLEIEAGNYSGQVRLEPPAEFTAAVYGYVRQACAGTSAAD